MQNLIHFDWAIKKLLRDKANFVVLEGFLTVVLNQQIKILEILESESNQEDESDKLDEWIYFLKNSKIPDSFTAPGLKEAREVLAEMKMSASERRAYEAFNKRLRDIASANFTKEADIYFARKEGMQKGREESKKEMVLTSIKAGLDNDTISKITGLAIEEIEEIRKS